MPSRYIDNLFNTDSKLAARIGQIAFGRGDPVGILVSCDRGSSSAGVTTSLHLRPLLFSSTGDELPAGNLVGPEIAISIATGDHANVYARVAG
jgi:hypothetical protein